MHLSFALSDYRTYTMRLYGVGVPKEFYVHPVPPRRWPLPPNPGTPRACALPGEVHYAADREDWLRRQLLRLG